MASSLISILVSGLPGKMAAPVAERVAREKDMDLFPSALKGQNQLDKYSVSGFEFELIPPERHGQALEDFKKLGEPVIAVDFSKPDAVNRNAELYCKHGIPFVMGTTGGDRGALVKTVFESGNTAVIAPNMAKPVVLLQAMLEFAAGNFPDALRGYSINVLESHQEPKKDVSGTALHLIRNCFNKLANPMDVPEKISVEELKQINTNGLTAIRDRAAQRQLMKIPEKYLGAHGWHTYTLRSPDNSVSLGFRHNIGGRNAYVDGTIDAIRFLSSKLSQGKSGVYSMVDVLRGAK